MYPGAADSPSRGTRNPAHWHRAFGTEGDVGEIELLADDCVAGSADRTMLHDRSLVFRFDDDPSGSEPSGQRVLFSALDEDEHPDLVGLEDQAGSF